MKYTNIKEIPGYRNSLTFEQTRNLFKRVCGKIETTLSEIEGVRVELIENADKSRFRF